MTRMYERCKDTTTKVCTKHPVWKSYNVQAIQLTRNWRLSVPLGPNWHPHETPRNITAIFQRFIEGFKGSWASRPADVIFLHSWERRIYIYVYIHGCNHATVTQSVSQKTHFIPNHLTNCSCKLCLIVEASINVKSKMHRGNSSPITVPVFF